MFTNIAMTTFASIAKAEMEAFKTETSITRDTKQNEDEWWGTFISWMCSRRGIARKDLVKWLGGEWK